MNFGKFGILGFALTLSTLTQAKESTPAFSASDIEIKAVSVTESNHAKPKHYGKFTAKKIIPEPEHPQYGLRSEPISVQLNYVLQGDNDISSNQSLRRIKEAIDYNQIINAFLAQPIDDRFYQTKLFSTSDSPYVSMTLHQKLTHDKLCQRQYGPCVVFERDSASGETVSTAYLITTMQTEDPMVNNIYRIPVDEKKFTAEITDILGNRTAGIYVYTNSAEPAAMPKAEAPPALSLNLGN